MNILFKPPHLCVARRAETLRRLAEELAPQELQGELRVLHPFLDEAMRLVLISAGSSPISIEVPSSWLYADLPEEEMRERLAELMQETAACGNRCVA